MPSYKIFCEGITDQIFIADCLEIFYGFTSTRTKLKSTSSKEEKIEIKFSNDIEVIEIGGCSRLSVDINTSRLEDNTDNDGINIVIFDADYSSKPNGNKGYNSCIQKLNDIKKNKNVDFQYYIWPNNNDDGIVENLLRQLIPSDKEVVYNCIETHQSCLLSISLPNLKIAELKEKVGYYLYTVNKDSRVSKRNYKDSQFWNLNYNDIEDLKKFKTFLDNYFSK